MIFGELQGEDAVALLSAELLGATGRAIGLDTLRVERGFDTDEFRADPGLVATDVDPSTRLTLSKRLRPDVELILSQSLHESGGLSADHQLQAAPQHRAARGVARQRRSLGCAAARDHVRRIGISAAAAAPPPPEVSAVTISGEPRPAAPTS